MNNNHPSTMVTFTLTRDNAKSIPDNLVHLIVAEGVTEIPERLCFRGYEKGIESLKNVLFSKSVTYIGEEAFRDCINLKLVIFPKDSQLRAIGDCVFVGCKSLQRIDIPDNITTIGLCAFIVCAKLESVLFTDQSCLQEIGVRAFHGCNSLKSIVIPNSVIEIGGWAFVGCLKLKSVIFAEHSSIQTINRCTFSECTSLQFINIPTTVTTIDEYGAFEGCPVLQVIDIPRQAAVNPNTFYDCKLLSTTLEEHGTDRIKDRFDALPIHQTCYKLNNNTAANDIINYFHSIQDNDPALLQVDIMGMTPLQILCANPAVTKDMINQLYNKKTEAAIVRNVNDMLPWLMYAVNKDKQFRIFKEFEDDESEDEDEYNNITVRMTDTARMILSYEFDANT